MWDAAEWQIRSQFLEFCSASVLKAHTQLERRNKNQVTLDSHLHSPSVNRGKRKGYRLADVQRPIPPSAVSSPGSRSHLLIRKQPFHILVSQLCRGDLWVCILYRYTIYWCLRKSSGARVRFALIIVCFLRQLLLIQQTLLPSASYICEIRVRQYP